LKYVCNIYMRWSKPNMESVGLIHRWDMDEFFEFHFNLLITGFPTQRWNIVLRELFIFFFINPQPKLNCERSTAVPLGNTHIVIFGRCSVPKTTRFRKVTGNLQQHWTNCLTYFKRLALKQSLQFKMNR